MTLMEKTISLGTRVAESDYDAIAEAADGNVAKFVREAVAEKMASIGRPITTELRSFGGKQAGAGRPVGARDKRKRTKSA